MKLSLPLLALATITAGFQAVPVKFDIRRGPTLQSSTKTPGSHAERLFKKELPALSKRATDGTAAIDLTDQSTYYAIDLTIGGQDFDVILDTGSSDLWVFGSNNPYCDTTSGSKEKVFKPDAAALLSKEKVLKPDTAALLAKGSPSMKAKRALSATASEAIQTALQTGANPESDETSSIPAALATIDCAAFGTLDPSSDDFSATDDLFILQYGDTTFALGLYGTGDVSFGDLTVKDFTFAVANQSNSTTSVFGVGLAGNEASTQDGMSEYSPNGPFQYDNLPLALKKQGTISTALYSLYMDEDTSEGTILFGGIDHAKYSGDLTTLKLVNYYEDMGISSPITFDVELQSASVSSDSEGNDVLTQPISVLLDSGTSFTYLPTSMVENIMSSLGADYDYSSGLYAVNCPTSTTGIEINFNFGDVSISVPIEQALYPVDSSSETCAVFIMPSADRYILGDTFLRNAYVVFDLENLEVQMAQYKSTSDSDIEVVGGDGSAKSSGNVSSKSKSGSSGKTSSSSDASSTGDSSASKTISSAISSITRAVSGFASASASDDTTEDSIATAGSSSQEEDIATTTESRSSAAANTLSSLSLPALLAAVWMVVA